MECRRYLHFGHLARILQYPEESFFESRPRESSFEDEKIMISKRVQFLIMLALVACINAQETVRQQLVREQKQEGLTLASFYFGKFETVRFASRSFELSDLRVNSAGRLSDGAVSRDGELIAFGLSFDRPYRKHLAVARSNGSDLRYYPEIESPSSLCWSYDKSKLLLNAAVRHQPHGELLIFWMDSKATEEVEAGGYATSQCWSPDDTQVVYGVGDSIRIYDLRKKKWREIAKGQDPTWSPDGNWIAFYQNDAYYAIRPSGADRRELFKRKDARTGLWWSPDNSIVAYIALGGKLPAHEHTFPFGPRQLRVRRLSDNADDWILVETDAPYIPSYQWVLPKNR